MLAAWQVLESARAPFDSKIVKVSRLKPAECPSPLRKTVRFLSPGMCSSVAARHRAGFSIFRERERQTDGKLPQRKQPGFNECFFFFFPPLPRDLIKKFLVIDRARRLGCMKVSLSDCVFLSHMSSLGCFLCFGFFTSTVKGRAKTQQSGPTWF